MGISLFRKKEKLESARAPAAASPAAPPEGAPERLTANEWARRLQLNEVAAERAAMRAGKWHERFTKDEFLALIRAADV